ncbi:hypothetical protein ACMV5I_28060 [Serratia sp. T13T92]|uniref:hypothetical protein n=1 Tax=unclassified Serratia (in: enterobacteria) TaxID=2647522 RepID=UPI001CBFAD22|nr:hypothetical protein [Serratia sp. JSRIV006]UAN65800.1 hypothetical protein KGP16_27105 [Serratia sp. JSRIV006]
MGDLKKYLPLLSVNSLFIEDLMLDNPPCFAFGYVEERGEKCGFIALRPEISIPTESTQQGMHFGHSVIGTMEEPVLHFAFEFYGHATYHGLVPSGNPIIQAVLNTMLETEDYFFFAINPDNSITAFRSPLDGTMLMQLQNTHDVFWRAICSDERYEQTVTQFNKNIHQPENVLKWVCRNNWDYLNLTKYRMELYPKP